MEGVAAGVVRQTFRSNLVRMAIEAGDAIEVAGAEEAKAVAASPPTVGADTESVKKKQRPAMIRHTTRSELERELKGTG